MITLQPMRTYKKIRRGTQVKTVECDPGIDDLVEMGTRIAICYRKPLANVIATAELADSDVAEINILLEARDRKLMAELGQEVPDPFPKRTVVRQAT